MRVHDSEAYRKTDVTRERISRILELREVLLSIQIGFSLVNAAVACAILESILGLEPSSEVQRTSQEESADVMMLGVGVGGSTENFTRKECRCDNV